MVLYQISVNYFYYGSVVRVYSVQRTFGDVTKVRQRFEGWVYVASNSWRADDIF